MKTDPTDTGGLFVRRRPGTAPVQYRELPEAGTPRRQRADGLLAHTLLGVMILGSLLFWGPIPIFGLWIASQVEFVTDNIGLGLLAGFVALLAMLFGGLVALKRVDQAWILVRRAAGVDQRSGVLPLVFGVTALVGATLFAAWLLLVGGLGPSISPTS